MAILTVARDRKLDNTEYGATAVTTPNNLPHQLTSFVGRAHECAEMTSLLTSTRLLTMTGPGGIGKTRLAIQVATSLLDTYPHGVYVVDLACLAEAELVLPSIAHTLGIREHTNQPLLDQLAAYMQNRNMLLILDNFEHVLDAALDVADLIKATDSLRILVTSRSALRLSAEQEFPVPPLPLPTDTPAASEQLAQSDAVQLFVERVRSVCPDFAITDDNVSVIAAICRRLDGLPLAIELAAARIRLLPPQMLFERLDHSLDLLKSNARDIPPRHQTLRNTIAWSYALLTPNEQTLFRRLAVFAGGFSLDAVTTICPLASEPWDEWEVLTDLESLVCQSLLVQNHQKQRFTMLKIVREYATELLKQSGEAHILRHCHAQRVLDMAEIAHDELDGPDQQVWTARLEVELKNVRAALNWSLRHELGDRNLGLRLAGAMARFWGRQRYHTEGYNWLTLALEQTQSAVQIGQESIAASDSPAPSARARALCGIGYLVMQQGDIEAARTFHQQSLTLRRQLDVPADVATSLFGLGLANVYWGNYAAAQNQLQESLAIFTTLRDNRGIALARRGLGSAALRCGDYPAARQHYQVSLGLAREQGNTLGVAIALNYLGVVLVQQGDYDQARHLLCEALALFQEIGHPLGIIESIQGLACVAGASGHVARATRLFAAMEALRSKLGFFLPPADHPLVVPYIVKTRAHMETSAFTTTWSAGQSLTMEQAIAFALEDEESPTQLASPPIHAAQQPATPPPEPHCVPQTLTSVRPVPIDTPPAALDDLTARESEVLQLLAHGLTNNQIARRLSLSTYTIQAHLRSIYGKLGVNSRSAATRYALEHDKRAVTPRSLV